MSLTKPLPPVCENRRFKFQKRSQRFIRAHNETLSVVAVCVCNKDRSPIGINSLGHSPNSTGFAEIVSGDFPDISFKSLRFSSPDEPLLPLWLASLYRLVRFLSSFDISNNTIKEGDGILELMLSA